MNIKRYEEKVAKTKRRMAALVEEIGQADPLSIIRPIFLLFACTDDLEGALESFISSQPSIKAKLKSFNEEKHECKYKGGSVMAIKVGSLDFYYNKATRGVDCDITVVLDYGDGWDGGLLFGDCVRNGTLESIVEETVRAINRAIEKAKELESMRKYDR